MRSKFLVMTTLSLLLVACKPAYTNNITNLPGRNLYEKISDEQINELTNVAAGIGRVEELVRAMLSREETWGANDSIVKELKTSLQGVCTPKMQESVSAMTKKRTMELAGTSCPITFKYIFEYQIYPVERNKMKMTGGFTIDDNSIANKIGVKTHSISRWEGVYQDQRASSGLPQFNMNFSGSGTATLPDGQEYTYSTHTQQYMETYSSGIAQKSSGFIRLTTPKNFLINLEFGVAYRLNDRYISKEEHFSMAQKLGILANGYKAYTEKY